MVMLEIKMVKIVVFAAILFVDCLPALEIYGYV